jgi:hypothetical protein
LWKQAEDKTFTQPWYSKFVYFLEIAREFTVSHHQSEADIKWATGSSADADVADDDQGILSKTASIRQQHDACLLEMVDMEFTDVPAKGAGDAKDKADGQDSGEEEETDDEQDGDGQDSDGEDAPAKSIGKQTKRAAGFFGSARKSARSHEHNTHLAVGYVSLLFFFPSSSFQVSGTFPCCASSFLLLSKFRVHFLAVLLLSKFPSSLFNRGSSVFVWLFSCSTALNRTYVSRGAKIGVFKHDDEDQLRFLTKIPAVTTLDGDIFAPDATLLSRQDTKMLLLNPDQAGTVYCMDLDRGQVVEEWVCTSFLCTSFLCTSFLCTSFLCASTNILLLNLSQQYSAAQFVSTIFCCSNVFYSCVIIRLNTSFCCSKQ